MIHRSRLRSLLAIATLTLAPHAAGSSEWNIEESRAPERIPVDFVVEEGTWMSLDVSPDGRFLVFDLLGHIYEMPISGGEARALTSGRSWNMFPRYSPDGGRIVLTSDRGGSDDLWVMDRETGAMTNVSDMPEGVTGGMWSADGRFLYGVAMHDGTKNTVYQFGFNGDRQVLIPAPEASATRPGAGFRPVNHFRDDAQRGLIFYEQVDGALYAAGGSIGTYDKRTGETRHYIKRPGGAVAPALSPDGRYLAYVHRRDQVSELVLHEIETRRERVLLPQVERDRQDYVVYHHAAYPTMAWMPDGESLVLWYGGGIHRVSVSTGEVREIPFSARVQREFDPTIRFRHDIPSGQARTRIHRWAQRTPTGILYETLGDLYLLDGDERRNLTASPDHETSPLFDARRNRVYFASWNDDELGALHSMNADGRQRRRLTEAPSHYAAPALSPDGERLAFVRGDARIRSGTRLEAHDDLELVTMSANGKDPEVVTEISWKGAGFGTRPPFVAFDTEGDGFYFTEIDAGALVLKSVAPDGSRELELYRFPHAAYAALSPDARWIAYEEYQRNYITPFAFAGKSVEVSAEDGKGTSYRIDRHRDGLYPVWAADGRSIQWTRGAEFQEKPVDAIVAGEDAEGGIDLSVSFDVAGGSGKVALTGARVLTMDAGRSVLENATVLVADDRIAAIGADVEIPAEAEVFDLAGRTIIPGIVDVHGHYLGYIAPTHVIEQRVATLRAALAHGVTTMYEVYGSIPKDTWLSDMLRAGRTTGPRLYTVGTPMYGVREFRPKTYRTFRSYDDILEQVRFNKAHGATALKDYITPHRAARHQLATAARAEGLNLPVEPGGEGQTNLTRLIDGATGIAHGMGFTSVYDDYIRFFAHSGLGITPTLIVTLDGPFGELWFHGRERLWENAKLRRFAREEDLLARLRRPQHIFEDDFFHPELAANLKRLFDAGVSMQLGAHGQLLGLDAHFEMELFAHGGFSNGDVLAIATIMSARHQGLDHELGSLEPGKLADLVVLTENPLEDIRATRAIEYVMKNGVLYSGEDAARIYPDPEPPGDFYFLKGSD